MMGAYIAARVAAVIAEHGESMTLRRAGETDLPLKGKRIGGGLDDTGNSAAQQRFKVKIAPTELAASAWAVKAPRRTDRLTVAGRDRTVVDATPLGDGGEVGLYELEVVG